LGQRLALGAAGADDEELHRIDFLPFTNAIHEIDIRRF